MQRRWFFLSMICFLVSGTISGFAMDCETPPFVTQAIEPNILIIFDNSLSMHNIIWIDSYDRSVDHTKHRLPADDNEIIFSEAEQNCMPDLNYVRYDSSMGKVRLIYRKATPGSTEICPGRYSYTQWSEEDGYFYFDRQSGTFITKSAYQSTNTNHIIIFLPYATYSVDPGWSTANDTLYDCDYLNWLFYDSTEDDRIALKQQHTDQDQRALLTRILVAKKVVRDLVETTDGVRFGFMEFNGSNGGSLEADVSSDKGPVLDAIDDVWPTGYTPLAEALEDAWGYFSDPGETPLQYWCQKNFVILMTDGNPTSDADNLGPLKGDWDNDSGGGRPPVGEPNEEDRYHGN